MRRGQASFEYILLLSFIFAVLIPGALFAYRYTISSQASVSSAQFLDLGNMMVMMAGQTVALGEGTWRTMETVIPDGIRDINVSGAGTELVITYESSVGLTQLVFFPSVVLAANTSAPPPEGRDGSVFASAPHAGRTSFRFTSLNGAVGITEVGG